MSLCSCNIPLAFSLSYPPPPGSYRVGEAILLNEPRDLVLESADPLQEYCVGGARPSPRHGEVVRLHVATPDLPRHVRGRRLREREKAREREREGKRRGGGRSPHFVCLLVLLRCSTVEDASCARHDDGGVMGGGSRWGEPRLHALQKLFEYPPSPPRLGLLSRAPPADLFEAASGPVDSPVETSLKKNRLLK